MAGKLNLFSGIYHAELVVMIQKDGTKQLSNYEGPQHSRAGVRVRVPRRQVLSKAVYESGGVARLFVSQLLACSSSTATMLEEGRAAESDADFVSKCSISLKECRESWTRLRICARCGLGPRTEVQELVQESSELIAIIHTIIRNKRAKMKVTPPARRRSTSRLLNS